VNEVKVKVVELKLSKAGIQRGLNDLRAVLAVPQLGGLWVAPKLGICKESGLSMQNMRQIWENSR
jgi:hypothetical protein